MARSARRKGLHSTQVEAIALSLLLWLTFVYFSQGSGPNQNSRFALTRALVEHSTVQIDAFASTTFDLARAGGHYYSDKAPGLAFLAVPAYWVYLLWHPAPTALHEMGAALHFATAFSVSLFSAIAGGLFYLVLLRRGHSRPGTLLVALAWMLATPAFAYSTLFYGHQLAAALVVMALALIEVPRRTKRPFARGVGLGLLLGMLVATEYPAILVATVLVAYARPFCSRSTCSGGALGISLVLLGLGLYQYRCFGSPFGAGYFFLTADEFAKTIEGGWFGFHLPRLGTILQLLFAEFRGLLPTAPWLLLAVLGALRMWRQGQHWQVALGGLGFGLPLLTIAAFARWDGGAAFGPRHLVYTLPLLASLVPPAFDAIAGLGRIPRMAAAVATGCLLVAGGLVCLSAVAVMPEFPDVAFPVRQGSRVYLADPKHPLLEFALPQFLEGTMSAKAAWADGRIGMAYLNPGHEFDAYNLGELWFGATGMMSLLPLAGLWILGAIAGFVRLKPFRHRADLARARARSGGA